MIDFEHWLTQLDDGEEQQEREWHTNQEELFGFWQMAYGSTGKTPGLG